MAIAVTAASGRLGRLVVESLLAQGDEPSSIVATARSVDKVADFADRGVVVRQLDYSSPSAAAFTGVDKVLLVSGMDIGQRAAQHRAVAEAAKEAGVNHIIYTSGPRAETSSMQLLGEHAQSEALLKELGVAYTILRNNWYFANYTGQIPTYLEHGAIVGSAGSGKIYGASHQDLADAAAAVLTSDGHENRIYELGGDEAFTMSDVASLVSKFSGKEVVYNDVPVDTFTGILESVGLSAAVASIFSDADYAISQGALDVPSPDLRNLIGRPTSSLEDAIKAHFS